MTTREDIEAAKEKLIEAHGKSYLLGQHRLFIFLDKVMDYVDEKVKKLERI